MVLKKDRALEKLMDNEFRYVIRHVNSFVSLKAERWCSLRKRYDAKWKHRFTPQFFVYVLVLDVVFLFDVLDESLHFNICNGGAGVKHERQESGLPVARDAYKHLPSDLILNILARLPADSVIQCKQVCKTWKDLLCQPSFPQAHLLHQLNGNCFSSLSSHTAANIPIRLLFSFAWKLERGNQLYYGEYDNQTRNKVRKINQPPIVGKSVIGSCNGLICFSESKGFYVLEPSYVCNPITGEYVNIPGIFNTKMVDYSEFIVSGFGYHRSTNEYKIVRIHYTKFTHLGRVGVYTLGKGRGWRETGTTTHSLRPSRGQANPGMPYYLSPFGTLANGALHWLNKEGKIVSFDLAKENVYLLQSPPIVRSTSVYGNRFQLQVLGGCLCFVHEKQDECLDIWFLRKTGESSSSDVNEQDDYDILSWIKELSIPIERYAEPCALTNRGEVLMH
ncbi:F-box protein At3g07870-like [Papaver somniferum]|uniref:F-box protein At3g07870-like n=1 Tax=Papaver somniferum TaxID=3469 RepID=UPI000E704C36|nr:F-box protein At3g07870-like [Papaver somniferum]